MPDGVFDDIPESNREFIPDFLAESEENLRILNERLLAMEAVFRQGGESSMDDLNAVFRAAHSMKGTAAFIGLRRLVQLAHKLETLLQQIRDGHLKFAQPLFDVLFTSFDALNSLLQALREDQPDGLDLDPILSSLDGFIVEVDPARKGPDGGASATVAARGNEPLEPVYHRICFLAERFATLLAHEEADLDREALIPALKEIMFGILTQTARLQVPALHDLSGQIMTILNVMDHLPREADARLRAVLNLGIAALGDIARARWRNEPANPDLADAGQALRNFLNQELGGVDHRPFAPAQTKPATEVPIQSDVDVDQLLDLQRLTDPERERLLDSLNKGCDAFRLLCLIEEAIPEKFLKVALMEQRLKRIGDLVSIRPDEASIEAQTGAVLVGIIFCSVNDEKDIRRSLLLDGVQLLSIDREDNRGTRAFLQGDSMSQEDVARRLAAVIEGDLGREPNDEPSRPAVVQRRRGEGISIIKIDSRKIDRLMILSGELVSIRAQFVRLSSLLRECTRHRADIGRMIHDVSRRVNQVSRAEPAVRTKNFAARDLPTPVRAADAQLTALNRVVQRIGEKVSASVLPENMNALEDTINALEKVSTEIQRGLMETRMVPIEGVFNRFKRIGRDIAQQIGKEILLEIIGAETELDKKIIDSVGEPLTHMVRNAIDHGIEDAALRERLGKPRAGRVVLSARHSGNNICIEISDDGRGMDPHTIARIAVERRLVDPQRVEQMSDDEKLRLIFLPGFSTAEVVTGLSGRGVGMDSVLTMITGLSGAVEIKSALGRGTSFMIKLPLTLAIIQGLLVDIGGQIYSFPLDNVQEILRVPADELNSVDGNVLIQIRGHALSLFDLRAVLRLPGGPARPGPWVNVVVVTDGAHRIGVRVDGLVCKEELVIKPLSQHFVQVRGLAGAALLADGRVCLILDTPAIMNEVR